jgi:class 3 adenylate cyclase/tetratricopeptide (TPR) repeat protein
MAVCPACGEENPEGFQFCGFCTAPLTDGLSAAPREERKVVSVLFCDLVGFTAASEAVDPEDVRARLRPYHARLREEVERFGGTMEKFVGDAVMAVFGAPLAHEDDAERAVRAGLRILEAIGELNGADPGLDLQVRVGINTGEGVVALGARPDLGEGIVAGDVVNTASRLQGAAPVDGIAVSEQTYRQTERVFDYEALEPVVVKGKTEPLPIFRPLRARADFGREVTRTHTTPLIGRDLEKSLLVGTFERAVQQRSCQLVTLVGEAGVGKSRLCTELARSVDSRPGLFRWRQGRCLPYGEGIAFWALGEIIKAESGILESDSPGAADAKLEQALPADDPDGSWLKARLAPLVGLPAEPASQEESFAAWRRVLESWAASRETVLVFEDLHWADDALLSFLEHLADWAEGVPLFVLCTARPELYERHSTFGANARNAQRINLSPLTDTETARLIGALLERAVLPSETQQTLLERAGGNPLYAEEFVRLVGDRGFAESVDVPESVQALIAARLDTLSPERKSLLQDAAVVGKVFWTGALAEMGARGPREVEETLHELSRKELVRSFRTSSMDAESEYGFWHVLVRDVCYQQIPRAARAARHQAAAAWLERKAGERVEDLADVLAHHYRAALELNRAAGIGEQEEQLLAQAIRYMALAGERALSLDVDQAEHQLTFALDLAPADDPMRSSLLDRWARAVQQQGRLQEAREAFEQALDLHRDRDEPIVVGPLMIRLALVLFRLGDRRSDGMIDAALELLEAQPHGPELVSAYTYTAGNRALTGRYPEAVQAAERAGVLASELGLPEPAFALHFGGVARCRLGEANGLEDIRRALGLALEQGLGREAGVIYNNLTYNGWYGEGPSAALAVCEEGIAFCERRGITEVMLSLRATRVGYLAELGRTEEALAETGPLADRMQAAGDISYVDARTLQFRLLAERGTPTGGPVLDEFVSAVREIGMPQLTAMALVVAGQVFLALDERDQAHAMLRELGQLESIPGFSTELPYLMRVALALDEVRQAERLAADVEPVTPLDEHAGALARAQLAEAAGRHADAALLYQEAAERWGAFGSVPERAYALLGNGRCLVAIGQPAAEVPLTEARELFASMGYKPALAETEKLLAETIAKTA